MDDAVNPINLISNNHKSESYDPQHIYSTLNRRINIRTSRSSLQSSTDDSVHSNSSVKSETDEEIRESTPPSMSSLLPHLRSRDLHEDESGFSSMNSFQEVGLPLINSTMISTGASSASSSAGSNADESVPTAIEKNENSNSTSESTLILTNKNNVPSQTNKFKPQYNHRRWDSAPVSSASKKINSTFSTFTNGDESLRVLWV